MIEWTPTVVENNNTFKGHIYVWNFGLPSEVWLWHLKDAITWVHLDKYMPPRLNVRQSTLKPIDSSCISLHEYGW
jgi:hypothetical protein